MIKNFKRLNLSDIILIKLKIYKDNRGYFFELYNQDNLFAIGINETFNQDNIFYSKKGVLRGLHYQEEPFV